MTNEKLIKFRRLCDDFFYEFVQSVRTDGTVGYKRKDMNLWIMFDRESGWIVVDEDSHEITGIPWNLPVSKQGKFPPEGSWISKKGNKSYVYLLSYAG